MIQGIHHTGLSTPDLERTVRFYVDLLGFEELTRFTMPPRVAGSATTASRTSACRSTT